MTAYIVAYDPKTGKMTYQPLPEDEPAPDNAMLLVETDDNRALFTAKEYNDMTKHTKPLDLIKKIANTGKAHNDKPTKTASQPTKKYASWAEWYNDKSKDKPAKYEYSKTAPVKPAKPLPPCHQTPALILALGNVDLYIGGKSKGIENEIRKIDHVIDMTHDYFSMTRAESNPVTFENNAAKTIFKNTYEATKEDESTEAGSRLRISTRDYHAPNLYRSEWLALADDIRTLADTASTIQRIFIVCEGGHGRSGTAAAILLYLLDPTLAQDKTDPINYLNQIYCKNAVESDDQEKYIYQILNLPLPEHLTRTPSRLTYTYDYSRHNAYTPTTNNANNQIDITKPTAAEIKQAKINKDKVNDQPLNYCLNCRQEKPADQFIFLDTCRQCWEDYSQSADMKDRRTEKPTEQNTVQCIYCAAYYSKEDVISEHNEKTGLTTHVCKDCYSALLEYNQI